MQDYYASIPGRNLKYLGSVKSEVINNDLDHILAIDAVEIGEEAFYVVAEFNYSESENPIPTITYEGKSLDEAFTQFNTKLMAHQSV